VIALLSRGHLLIEDIRASARRRWHAHSRRRSAGRSPDQFNE